MNYRAINLHLLQHLFGALQVTTLFRKNCSLFELPFIPSALDKLKAARKLIDDSGYDIRLEIDGGVKVDNIREIAEAGADTFVAGSAIFGSDDYKATITAMREQLAAVNS